MLDIQARWETLRAEAELLVSSHHLSGEVALWTRGEKELEDSGRWQQLWRCSCLSRSASTCAPSEPDWTDPDWISTSGGNFPLADWEPATSLERSRPVVQTRQVLGQSWSGWKTEVLTKQTGLSSGMSSQPALTNSSRSLLELWRRMLSSPK